MIKYILSKNLFILIILFLTLSSRADQIKCNPVGQFVQPSALTNHSINFLDVLGEPKFLSAEINTANCLGAKLNFTLKDYTKLQQITASAEDAFVIMQKGKHTNDVACLTGIRLAEEILNQQWRRTRLPEAENACVELHGLVKLTSIDGISSFYINIDQAKLLTLRRPASTKKKGTVK